MKKAARARSLLRGDIVCLSTQVLGEFNAAELCARMQINYYDALILATARLAGCTLVYSEDLNSGQGYGGVRVVNPILP